ncbi:MAG: PLP-dependent aspartate aminotransferase family protein [Vicinamibacterales bacterium]
MDDQKTPALATQLLHAGEGAVPSAAPLTTPIYETTTFVFASAAEVRQYHEGGGTSFLYSRYANPTVESVERKLAVADAAEGALVFASGMAAISAVLLAHLSAGDEVLCSAASYGGTFHLLEGFLPRLGITTRFVGLDDLQRLSATAGASTRLVWFESPVNPHLRCVDVAAVAAQCRALGLLSVIDNTFASPVNQQPLALGVDLSVQSATKYLNGHSDITAGVVSGSAERLRVVADARRQLGGVLDPQAAYALGRGLKTLPLRVARQNATAQAVAEALEGDPRVARVLYPGLASHPDHDIARRQMRGFGGMVCLDLVGGEPAAERAFDRLRLVRRAASLGGVESLCSLPILSSQWGHTDAQLAAAGITRGMLRLSLGLEDAADLIADLRQALD